MFSESGQNWRSATTSATSKNVLPSVHTLGRLSGLSTFVIFRQVQNENEKYAETAVLWGFRSGTRLITVCSFFPPSIFHSIHVFQPESSLLDCVHCVFSSPLTSPQSLRWRVTPHNFTAVFVCNRGCRWIWANKAAAGDARRGTKDDTCHASPSCSRISQLPAKRMRHGSWWHNWPIPHICDIFQALSHTSQPCC